jgi:hypothetical protein
MFGLLSEGLDVPIVDTISEGSAVAGARAGFIVVGEVGDPEELAAGAVLLGCTSPAVETTVSRGVVAATLPVFVVDEGSVEDPGAGLLRCTMGTGATSVVEGNGPEPPAMTPG